MLKIIPIIFCYFVIFLSACNKGSLSDSRFNVPGVQGPQPYATTYHATLQSIFSTGGGDARHLSVSGNYGFLSLNNSNLAILNLSNINSIYSAATISQSGESLRSTINGNFVLSSAGSSSRVFVSNIGSAPSYTPVAGLLHNNTPSVQPQDSFVDGSTLYVATGNDATNSSVTIWDFSNPAAINGLSVFTTTQKVNQVVVSGSIAYLAESNNGLHVVDVSIKTAPAHVRFITGLGNVTSAKLNGMYLYAGSSTGLHIFSISAPGNPQLLQSIATAPVLDLNYGSSTLVVTMGNKGFSVYNISIPAAPNKLVSVVDGYTYYSCAYQNGYYMFSAGVAGVRVFEIIGDNWAAYVMFATQPGTFYNPMNLGIYSLSYAMTYYTTDGTDPKTSVTRQVYTGQIPLNTTTIVKAYSRKNGYLDSQTISGTFAFSTSAADPVASPASGEIFNSTQWVTLTSATNAAVVYYTLDGSDPQSSGTRLTYSNGFWVTPGQILKAVATKSGYSNSAVLTIPYMQTVAAPTFSPSWLTPFAVPVSVTMSSASSGAVIRYTTDGSDPINSATAQTYSASVTVSSTKNLRACALNGVLTSGITEGAYTVTNAVTKLNPGISGNWTRIAADPADGRPYILYQNTASPYQQKVSKLTGSGWVDLGAVSAGQGYDGTILIDRSDNKPVVAYIDLSNSYRVTVKKWSSGTTWTNLGTVSSGIGSYMNAAMDSNNRPIIIFRDNNDNYKNKVFRWQSGTVWTDMGAPATNGSRSAVIANSLGLVFVAISESSGSQQLHGFSWSGGTSWTDLGYISAEAVNGSGTISMAIDPVSNLPLVYYPAVGSSESGGIVKRWNSTAWQRLGNSGQGTGSLGNIAVDSAGTPYIVFMGSSVYASQVRKWSGTAWTELGLLSTESNTFGWITAGNTGKVYVIMDAPFSPAFLNVVSIP